MLLSECSNKGINIDIDNPKTLGDDLLAGAVGAVNMFNFPAIIFDLGTATTISVIDKTPALIGGAIMPGYKLSLCALVKHCDLINDISSHTPSSVIGKNTESCIISGLVYSTASMIDGMCERIEEELGCSCHIIATGGLAESVLPYCKRKDIVLSKELVLEGLRILYEINN
jgi:type III pantothenate kinase